MGDDLFTMPDDSLDFSNFNLGDQQLLPMMPTPDDNLYGQMLPFNPDDPTGMFDLGLLPVPGSSGGGGGGGSSGGGASMAAQVMRALGLQSPDNGGIGQLLMAALGIGGGLFNRTQTQHATDQTVGALRDANTQATNILGHGNTAFQPYADLGAYAAHGLQNMPLTPIAGNFNSLGTGRGIKLGALAGR